jgi:hypothetical protein
VDQAGPQRMTVHPEPISGDVNPYPVITPIPYAPDDPVFTEPVVPAPEPEREYLTAQQAIDRAEEAKQEVVATLAAEPAPEPPMVTTYKRGMA